VRPAAFSNPSLEADAPSLIFRSKTELSSRPERTRISYFALLATTTRAALRSESRMDFINATTLHRKSGGAQWRNLLFLSGSHADLKPGEETYNGFVLIPRFMVLVCGTAALGSMFLMRTIFQPDAPHAVDFVLLNSPTPQKYLIETMGGGVAILDYNNDGLPDLFFVNGGRIISGPPERFARSEPKYWNRLYRQNRDGAFTDVTKAAGLSNAGDGNYGMGVAVADYDNDGYPDIFVTSYGKNILYHNNQDGTFTDVTEKAGVAGGGWSASAGFFDYDNDGRLDLFVTRYMEWNTRLSKVCNGDYRTYCPPEVFPATTNLLYHNNGDGTFTDVSTTSGIGRLKARSLGVAFNDYDGDGYTDIFVSNDGMQEFLFHNNGNGTFTERALEAGVGFSDDGSPYAGMGIDFRDYDNDGRPDLIVTNLAKQVYAVYHNDGNGSFSYQSLETGIGNLTAASSGWGVRFEDFDNDGRKDLLVAQGHVMDNVDQIDPSKHYRELPLLAMNRGPRFERADTGVTTPVAGRGLAIGDLNNDGSTDAVITVLGGSPIILLNHAGGAHWLTVSLRGTRSNRDGAGAILKLNGQTQYAGTAGSYLSASDKRVHFGLGSATSGTLEIDWPSGTRQVLKDVKVDRFMEVTEPTKP
jgi:enediyne biosynthesis protein E4